MYILLEHYLDEEFESYDDVCVSDDISKLEKLKDDLIFWKTYYISPVEFPKYNDMEKIQFSTNEKLRKKWYELHLECLEFQKEEKEKRKLEIPEDIRKYLDFDEFMVSKYVIREIDFI